MVSRNVENTFVTVRRSLL